MKHASKDAAWLADLMAHGLLSGSFVPDQATQEMRDLLRTRKQLVRERTSHTQRIQKTLECANIKLDSVVSNVVGVSGRRMLEALISGQSDPRELAAMAHGRARHECGPVACRHADEEDEHRGYLRALSQ